MLVPWVLGFVTYQLINPGYVEAWAREWLRLDGWFGFTPASWMSASLISFAVAAVSTVPVGLWRRRRGHGADSRGGR